MTMMMMTMMEMILTMMGINDEDDCLVQSDIRYIRLSGVTNYQRKTHVLHQLFGVTNSQEVAIAQSVEYATCRQEVVGSIPFLDARPPLGWVDVISIPVIVSFQTAEVSDQYVTKTSHEICNKRNRPSMAGAIL